MKDRRLLIPTWIATVVIASMLAVVPALAQPGTDVLAGEDALSEVSIDVNPTDPDNLVIVGHDAALVTMNTFFTTDGGDTWTAVTIGNADDGITSPKRFDPSVAFDDDGNVYAAYGADDTSNPTNTTLVVAKSEDGGASWTQFTQIATNVDVGPPGNDKWHLATGPAPGNPAQQNVYVAWTQNITEPNLDQRIVVSASTDEGATFGAPVIINDGSISGTDASNLFADPAVGPNGDLFVLWHDIDNDRILFDSSTDGGATWGTDIQIATTTTGLKTSVTAAPDRGVHSGPMLDVDRTGAFPGRLYATYTDVAEGGLPDIDVFVQTSDDGGATWTARVQVNDDGGDGTQFLPWLDIDQETGLASLVWYDTRNDGADKQAETFISVSQDGGATWSANTLVSDNPSDMSTDNTNRYLGNYLEYIGVATYDCLLVPVWADNSESGGDLDYYIDRIHIEGGDLCNDPPVADANGPYTTNEGVDATLDGTGSSDLDGDPLTFEWDLDDDGVFDDAVGPMPTFDMVGQDGTFTIRLRVTDPDGAFDVDQTTVTVQNVAPTVSLGSNAPADENSPVTVTGTISDPGWLETLSGTIDWGDGTPLEVLSGTLENVRPDATSSFSAMHTYGDNGVFTAEVCGSDDDTTTCATIPLTVDNVDPTADIDESDAVLINGIPTIIGTIGDPVDFTGNSVDPGSDDLFLSWDWGDGPPSPDITTDYLVNPPSSDPFPSPDVDPRDVTDMQSHAFDQACLYEVGFSALDDDLGSAMDSIWVIITGDAEHIRSAGYWYQQYRQGRAQMIDDATLECYLEIVNFVSTVFSETRSATTIDEARDILKAKLAKVSPEFRLDRQLLAAWLDFANGAVALDELVDTDGDFIPDTVYVDMIAAAEAVRNNPGATDAQLLAQMTILDYYNNSG